MTNERIIEIFKMVIIELYGDLGSCAGLLNLNCLNIITDEEFHYMMLIIRNNAPEIVYQFSKPCKRVDVPKHRLLEYYYFDNQTDRINWIKSLINQYKHEDNS
jgi:hypothetical protein